MMVAWREAYWRCDWSNQLHKTQLLKTVENDVVFISFTDKNLFISATLKNWRNNWLDATAATVMSVSVSELEYTGLILVDPRVKIDEICYCDLLLSQQLLPVTHKVSGKFRNMVLSCNIPKLRKILTSRSLVFCTTTYMSWHGQKNHTVLECSLVHWWLTSLLVIA